MFILLGASPVLTLQAQSLEGCARAAALGGAATALPGEACGQANPAAWATLPGRAINFFASEAFGLAELRLGAVYYAEPTGMGTFAAGARTFGFEAFRETFLDVGYAHGAAVPNGPSFFGGIRLRYRQVRIAGYGRAAALEVSLGWLARLTPSLHLGFQAANVHAPSLVEGVRLPRTFAVGLSYVPASRLQLLLDVLKDVRFPLSVRAGAEFLPVPALALRTGLTTEPTRFTAGIGIRAGNVAADVAAERHEALGWSPAVGFGLQW